ncbi:MAG: sensor histidine kinase [Eubacterium sp.]
MFKITENYEQKQTLTLIEMKNEMLQKSQNDTELAFKLWRNSIHDYKNNIIALTQLAKEGKLEEIKEYLIKENQLLNQKMFYVKTGNSVVDAIINTKQNLAEQKGIVFTVNVSIPEECKVNDIDMASMLGNLIDNAIEACSNQNNSYIDVTIKEEKQILLIKISNIYKGILPEQMQSTKKDRLFHGIGIKSVKSIVEKYNGEYNMIHRDNEVVTTILILNK